MYMFDSYRSQAQVTCYDGDEGVTDEQIAQVADEIKAGEIKVPAGYTEYTSDQQTAFNKAVAVERYKLDKKLKDALTKQERMYKDTLSNNKNLTDKERGEIHEQLATVQGQLRTEKQQAQIALKELEEQFSGKLTAAEKRAAEAESKYRDSTIKRALQDAAVSHEAYRPEQVVKLLGDWTKLVDDKVVVDFPDEDATTGEAIVTTRTPDEAVKRMKEKPDLYGNLFRNNVVSGIGSNSATGGASPGKDGVVDVRKLSQAQYRDLRAKNPAALGLK